MCGWGSERTVITLIAAVDTLESVVTAGYFTKIFFAGGFLSVGEWEGVCSNAGEEAEEAGGEGGEDFHDDDGEVWTRR